MLRMKKMANYSQSISITEAMYLAKEMITMAIFNRIRLQDGISKTSDKNSRELLQNSYDSQLKEVLSIPRYNNAIENLVKNRNDPPIKRMLLDLHYWYPWLSFNNTHRS
jgi:hypothetical protein